METPAQMVDTELNEAVKAFLVEWDSVEGSISAGLILAHDDSGWRGDDDVYRLRQALSRVRKAINPERNLTQAKRCKHCGKLAGNSFHAKGPAHDHDFEA